MNASTVCLLSFLFVDPFGTAHMSAHEIIYNVPTERAMMLAAIDLGRTKYREYRSNSVDSGFACEGGRWIDMGLDEEIGNMIAEYVGLDEDTVQIDFRPVQEGSVE